MHIPSNKILKALAISSVVILIVIKSSGLTTSLRIRLTDLASPVLAAFRGAITASKRILPFAALREENRLLRGRYELLLRRAEELKAVADESERLKGLLGFTRAAPYKTIPAQVIGRDPTNWSNSIIIDKGSTHGVRQNRAVVSTRGLVGRTLEVGRLSSKVLLITDPGSKAGVVIERNRQGGILLGRPDGRCKMIYISLDSDAAVGDKVMTAGLGSVFPKGIFVGEVVKVDKEPGRLYKYAIVEPAQDLSRLEEVMCAR